MTPISPHAEAAVRKIYRELSRAWGPQHWWPAATVFEVIVGAILTQNTSWTNVERALANLRQANALSVEVIRSLPLAELEQLIRPSGYYRQKAARLKGFLAYLDQRYGGSLEQMFATPASQLRDELLSLKGIGQETADAILLYAAQHEVFVVDAYARRILARHGVIADSTKYEEIRNLVERALRAEKVNWSIDADRHLPAGFAIHEPSAVSTSVRSELSQVFNEMHGLLVQAGKHYCWKTEPKCASCPLGPLLPSAPQRL